MAGRQQPRAGSIAEGVASASQGRGGKEMNVR